MISSRTIASFAVALTALALLSACSREPGDPVASARELSDAPSWVSKPTGVDCGSFELGARRVIPTKNLACMTAATKGAKTAFLTWTERTTEGDPIPHFVRTTRSGITAASTTAYDTYGKGGWSETTCPNVAEIISCEDTAN